MGVQAVLDQALSIFQGRQLLCLADVTSLALDTEQVDFTTWTGDRHASSHVKRKL